MSRRARSLGLLLVLAPLALLLSACNPVSTLARPWDPVVVTGAEVSSLAGTPVDRLVAFRITRADDVGTWTQIPVQVDQRHVVPFGIDPATNAAAGTPGTVYGNGSGGPTALQYSDPDTWVGADPNPNLDADDEIALMARDAGGQARTVDGEPAGVVAGSGVALEVTDPRADGEHAWIYLFRSTGGLDPAAGVDYVDYAFELTSGDYRTTYHRADGPNPETSWVETASYRIELTDRWKETSWEIGAGSADGTDIVDAYKNQFAPGYCGRSNATFADAEGAFVANIDGPVRAIRSYVGANSGPLTQRTHRFYAERVEVETVLRVHSIPGVVDYVDYGPGAVGMTYRSNQVPGGVAVDGVDDPVPTAAPRWESVDGPQGRVYTAARIDTAIGGLSLGGFYRDQSDPAEDQCWGDDAYLGASGIAVTGGIPNTDPRTTPFADLRAIRTTQFLPPAASPSQIPAYADDWVRDVDAPLVVRAARYQP